MKLKDGFEVNEEQMGLFVARATGERAEEFPQPIQMGFSGAYLWDLLTKEDLSRADLIFRLDNLYECEQSTEQIESDVDMFVGFLREMKLLEE